MTNPDREELVKLADEIEVYGFECEAGPLANCRPWTDLKHRLSEPTLSAGSTNLKPRKHYFTPCSDNPDKCLRCGHNFRDANVHCRSDETPETDAEYIERLETALRLSASASDSVDREAIARLVRDHIEINTFKTNDSGSVEVDAEGIVLTLTDAIALLPAQAVKVKSLEWTVEKRYGYDVHVGRGTGLMYEAAIKAYSPGGVVAYGGETIFNSDEADEDAAKAAAQADYEARIRSALITAPPADGMREALESARAFIASEYASSRAAVSGEWLAPEARSTYAKIITALTAPGATTKSDGGACAGGVNPGWDECPECGATSDEECRFAKSGVEALAATTAERPGTVTSEPEPSTSDLKTSPELLALLERAKNHVMTPEEIHEQRRSFAKGMCPSHRDYKEWCEQIDKLVPPLNPSDPSSTCSEVTVSVSKDTLLSLISALDRATGDTDPAIDPDATDEEVMREYPVFWVCQKLSALLDQFEIRRK